MSKRKQWNEEDMGKALEAVKKSEATVSKAAKQFNVPRKTLDDRVKGRVCHGSKSGPATVFTSAEEDILCNYLIYVAERGFPLTRRMVMAYAWSLAKKLGRADRFNKDVGPGEHWWSNFRKRHPFLTLRKLDKLDRSRARNCDPVVINKHFELLKKVLDENNLTKFPRRIYNCDESFLPLDGSREKGVTHKKSKCMYAQVNGTTEHITMLCGASAAGVALPPMIIYPKAFPGGAYTFKGPDDAVYAKSESGWVDSDLFLAWMKKIFLVHAVSQRPVILIVDGHGSHVNLELIDLARNNNIILFCLPPHTTHLLQPLDVSVFKSLKDNFYRSLRAFCFVKKSFVVSKKEFASVVKEPFEKALCITNIKAGFRKCGIYPFNPDVIDKAKLKPSEMYSPVTESSSKDSNQSNDETADSSSSPPDLPSVSDSPVNNSSSSSVRKESSNENSIEHDRTGENSIEHDRTGENSIEHDRTGENSIEHDRTGENSIHGTSIVNEIEDGVRDNIVDNKEDENVVMSESASSSDLHNVTPTRKIVTSPPVENPLVAAGLVPTELAEIFCTPTCDNPVKRRRLTNARVLTENEYYHMLKEKEQKEKEEQEAKEKRKKERELKRIENEEKKKKCAEEKLKRQEERKRKAEEKGKKRQGETSGKSIKTIGKRGKKRVREEETSESSTDEDDILHSRSSSSRSGRLPSRFRDTSNSRSSSDSEDSEITCGLCGEREPPNHHGKIVFWIDCDKCGEWFHTSCSKSSKKYICSTCK